MRFSLLPLILCSTSLICSYVKKVNAKSQDFIDNDINSDESSLAGTPNHPHSNILWLNTWNFIFTILMRHYLIVGIPIGTWKITDLNINEKESLCQKQQNYCSVSCFTKRKATKKKNKCIYWLFLYFKDWMRWWEFSNKKVGYTIKVFRKLIAVSTYIYKYI